MMTDEIQWKPSKRDPTACIAYLDGVEVGWVSDDDGCVVWWARGPHRQLSEAARLKRLRIQRCNSNNRATPANPSQRHARFVSLFGEASNATAAKRGAEQALAALYSKAA